MAIRVPQDGADSEQTFVVSLGDVTRSPEVYTRLRGAEEAYRTLVARWRGQLGRIRSRKSDPVPRWKLADEIVGFRKKLQRTWRFEPTNYQEAIARDIRISKSALGYLVTLRERINLNDVTISRLNWSKLQELLDIKDSEMMRKCIQLIRAGKITSDEGIRDFKRLANAAKSRQ